MSLPPTDGRLFKKIFLTINLNHTVNTGELGFRCRGSRIIYRLTTGIGSVTTVLHRLTTRIAGIGIVIAKINSWCSGNLRLVSHGKVWTGMHTKHFCGDIGWELAYGSVISLNGLDITTTCHGNTVFGAFELCL